jgi:cardiolipin synthase
LARRFDASSVLGAYLDPLADKILLTAAYVSLAIPHGQEVVIPLWLALLALFRDFMLMLMAFVFYMFEGLTSFPPSVAGKATTLMQVVTVGVVLLANVMAVPMIIPQICFYVSFILVITSGFNYIYRSSRSIEAERQAREGAGEIETGGEVDEQGDRRR